MPATATFYARLDFYAFADFVIEEAGVPAWRIGKVCRSVREFREKGWREDAALEILNLIHGGPAYEPALEMARKAFFFRE